MIPSSSAVSALLGISLNNPATHARGPLSKVTGVSNNNSQLVRKDAEQQFVYHYKSVTELLTHAVSLAQSGINTSETYLVQRAQEPVNGELSRDSVDNHAEVTQNSRAVGGSLLNEKIASALKSLPSGERFSAQKAETAKQALLNEITTFQLPHKTLVAFTAIVENNSSKPEPRAMKYVEDFMVMRHEIKSRLAPDDSKTLNELNNVTKSFISTIARNGVGMDSAAAGSSKNYSELKKHEAICSKIVVLDEQSQQSSGLSYNVEISNRISESLTNAGLTQDEYVQVMDSVHNIFRDSISEQNSILSAINRSSHLSSFEQAQTRLGQESITFDLLRNALADIAQPKADDAANPGPGPEIEMGPSNQPGINITINAPFTYTYHEGNQGSEAPGMASGSQQAFTTSSGTTQTDDPIVPQSVMTAVRTLSEEMDSSTHPLQDSQRRAMANVFERSVQHTPDLSEQNSQTTYPDESPHRSVSRGLGSSTDAVNELHHDVIDAAMGPAVQPTGQQEEQNTVIADRTDQASGTDGDPASLRSPVSSYIGGPGSSGARANSAEARRIAQGGPGVLNSQGTPFQGLNSGQAGKASGTPASQRGGTSTSDAGTTRNRGTQTPGSTPSQGADDEKARSVTGHSAASATSGSLSARANPTEAPRSTQEEPGMLNRQGSHWQGLDGKQASKVTPGQTYKSSSFVGSRGSSQATPYFSGVSKSTAKK